MKLPPYVQRGLMVLVVLLSLVSVARLLVTMHQQDERIAILEAQVEALMADTSRLQLADGFYAPRRGGSQPGYSGYQRKSSGYHRSSSSMSHRVGEGAASDDTVQSSSPRVHLYNSSADEDRPRKFTEPHLFDLNTIDSLTLIRIPGIAARTASVILKQRQRYGGFYDANQLRDFLTWEAAQDYLDEWCSQWFTANAERIVLLPINTATISQLQHHPYLSHQQAVEISQYRVRHKGFRQASELQMLSSLTDEDIQHLLPYLSFENP